MKLTEEEAQYIVPGIYRGSIWVEPPNLAQPASDKFIKEAVLLRHSQISLIDGYLDFYPSPQAFLEAWIAGYRDFSGTQNDTHDRSHINPHAKGFELEYITWHPEDRHFLIARKAGLFAEGTRFNRTLIASDINGMNDQRGYMNVGINDFPNERVLVWRGIRNGDFSEEIPYGKVECMEKRMRDDIRFYCWDTPEKFPFGSPNPLKSAGVQGIWTMVGFEPEVVYEELKKCGFIFPAVRHAIPQAI